MPAHCAFKHPAVTVRCGRAARRNSTFCIFHETDVNRQVSDRRFAALLRSLDRKGDGNWVGFHFPARFEISWKGTISSAINVSHATFGKFSLRQTSFTNTVNADRIVAFGEFALSVKFVQISCRNAQFQKSASLGGSCESNANFSSVTFHGSAEFRGEWRGLFSLENATFLDFVDFSGGWAIFASTGPPVPEAERRPLFHGQANLQNINFAHPTRVRFRTVSLENALFAGTDMYGAHFYDVTWAEPELGRFGLFDETHVMQSTDRSYRHRVVTRVEAAYRNFRLALEKNHDYSTATDFYVGEMRIRRQLRKQGQARKNYIEDLYRLLSNYGASPIRATACLVGLAAAHFAASQWLICAMPEAGCLWNPSIERFLDQAANTVRIVTLQRFVTGWDSAVPAQSLLDSVVAGLAPIQIALIVLAIRARIRR